MNMNPSTLLQEGGENTMRTKTSGKKAEERCMHDLQHMSNISGDCTGGMVISYKRNTMVTSEVPVPPNIVTEGLYRIGTGYECGNLSVMCGKGVNQAKEFHRK